MILNVEGISFSYPGQEVLKNIDFQANKGEIICILGPNGTGKTTLLKCINNILKPSVGSVMIEDLNVQELPCKELAKKIGYVEQQRQGQACTVFDAVLLGRKPYIRWDVTSEDIEIVGEALETLKMSSYSNRLLTELSGGELQKVIIARALAQEPLLLLMDEPTNHLDLRNQIDVLETIREITLLKNITSIITMHDLNLSLSYGDKFILMKDKGIYQAGNESIITPKNINEVYSVDVDIIRHQNKKIIIPI